VIGKGGSEHVDSEVLLATGTGLPSVLRMLHVLEIQGALSIKLLLGIRIGILGRSSTEAFADFLPIGSSDTLESISRFGRMVCLGVCRLNGSGRGGRSLGIELVDILAGGAVGTDTGRPFAAISSSSV
jgi:hypothetical protein